MLFSGICYSSNENCHWNRKRGPMTSGFLWVMRNLICCSAWIGSKLLLLILQPDLFGCGCFISFPFLTIAFLKSLLMISENQHKRNQRFPKYVLLEHLWSVLFLYLYYRSFLKMQSAALIPVQLRRTSIDSFLGHSCIRKAEENLQSSFVAFISSILINSL